MDKYRNLIETATLLKPIPTEDISKYLKEGLIKTTDYGKNCVVHFEGELCSSLGIILSGKVAVERIDQSGNIMTVTEFNKDDVLGGNLLFSKNPYYPMTITAKKSTIILEINKDILFEHFCKNPEFLQTFLEFISDNALILGDKIRLYVNRTIRESILSFLENESICQQSKYIKLNEPKKVLAERIGVQRTSLSRELAKMKRDGLILFDNKSITILEITGENRLL